ncbi:hypothetical protein WJX77_009181 [Trebouxia sp. C0004]
MITRSTRKRYLNKAPKGADRPVKKGRLAQSGSIPPAVPPPQATLCGAALLKCIAHANAACCPEWPPGTQLWVKLRGMCHWPVVMWSMELCMKKDVPQLLTSFREGHVAVRFYGEHSSMWVRPEDLVAMNLQDDSHLDKLHALRAHPKLKHKAALVEAAMEEMSEAHADCCLEVQRMLQLHNDYLANEDAPDICYLCREEGARLVCSHCERLLHPLCLQPPALSSDTMLQLSWECSSCGETNTVGDASVAAADKEKQVERMGLTPDWIIRATAFNVFQLSPPTPEQPFIKGLLDPCTNSLLAPNIPAEKLYDKVENGLKLSNSWAGYHILLNPDYSAQILWRFVNRAIDEVENHQVPAVVLVCRNSTDTAYFQRLRPYPRIMLRRMKCLFKDYDKTPIGFGVVVFCIAKSDCRDLYERFFDAFAHEGEPNIPIDRQIMQSPEFYHLLERLRQHAELHQRDHWIECSQCSKWRIISYAKMTEAKDADWVCRLLRPPYSSCRTPQTKRELLGVRYAVQGVDGTESLDDLAPSSVSASEPEPVQAQQHLCEGPQLTPENITGADPDPSLHTPPAEAASPKDQTPGSVSQPRLVSSGSTGSNDSCATAAMVPSTFSEQQGEDTALATGSTPAPSSKAAASGQRLPQVNAVVRNIEAVAETPALGANTAVAPPISKRLVDKVSVAMSEVAPLPPKATPGAAIGIAQVTDESLAHWVKLPQHRLKGRAAPDVPSAEQPWQVLTALELARQARIAANRAYLAGLQKGPDAMSKGEVQPLQVADPAVLAAARQLATSAALCQAKNQLDDARKQLAARQKLRTREEARLRKALATLESQAAGDAQQVVSAQKAHQDLLTGLPAYMTPPAPKPTRPAAAAPVDMLPMGKVPVRLMPALKAPMGKLPTELKGKVLMPKGPIGRASRGQSGPAGTPSVFTGPLGQEAASTYKASLSVLSHPQTPVHQLARQSLPSKTSVSLVPRSSLLMSMLPVTQVASLPSATHQAAKSGFHAAQGQQAGRDPASATASRACTGPSPYGAMPGTAQSQASQLPTTPQVAAAFHHACPGPPATQLPQKHAHITVAPAAWQSPSQLASIYAQQTLMPHVPDSSAQRPGFGSNLSPAYVQEISQSSGIATPHRLQRSAHAVCPPQSYSHASFTQSPSDHSAPIQAALAQMPPRATSQVQVHAHQSNLASSLAAFPQALMPQQFSPTLSPGTHHLAHQPPTPNHSHRTWQAPGQVSGPYQPSSRVSKGQGQAPSSCAQAAQTQAAKACAPQAAQPGTAQTRAATQHPKSPQLAATGLIQHQAAPDCAFTFRALPSTVSRQPTLRPECCVASTSAGSAASQAASAASAVPGFESQHGKQVAKRPSEAQAAADAVTAHARQSVSSPVHASAETTAADHSACFDNSVGHRRATSQTADPAEPCLKRAQAMLQSTAQARAMCTASQMVPQPTTRAVSLCTTAQAVSHSAAPVVPRSMPAPALSQELLAVFIRHSQVEASSTPSCGLCSDHGFSDTPDASIAADSALVLPPEDVVEQGTPWKSQVFASHVGSRSMQIVPSYMSPGWLQQSAASHGTVPVSDTSKLDVY